MGIEEKVPSGFLLTTVEQLAGYFRKNSLWPATFGLACCAIEMMATPRPRDSILRALAWSGFRRHHGRPT